MDVRQERQGRGSQPWGICWQLLRKGRKKAASSEPPPCIIVATPQGEQCLVAALCGAHTVPRDPACAAYTSRPTLRAGLPVRRCRTDPYIHLHQVSSSEEQENISGREKGTVFEESLGDSQVEFDSGS